MKNSNNSQYTANTTEDKDCKKFHEDAETHTLRRHQDIECLTLLTEAARLNREFQDIDSMMVTLQGGESNQPPLSPAMLMALGLSK